MTHCSVDTRISIPETPASVVLCSALLWWWWWWWLPHADERPACVSCHLNTSTLLCSALPPHHHHHHQRPVSVNGYTFIIKQFWKVKKSSRAEWHPTLVQRLHEDRVGLNEERMWTGLLSIQAVKKRVVPMNGVVMNFMSPRAFLPAFAICANDSNHMHWFWWGDNICTNLKAVQELTTMMTDHIVDFQF